MADTKITALAAITTVDPAADVLPIVDISDTSMAASGTTKKITSNQILGAGGTATLASATITGAATVGTTLGVTGVSTLASASVTGALGAAGLNVTGATIPANGVYLGSANNLSFSYASTLGMTLNATGLGIGGSPSFKLDVHGDIGVSGNENYSYLFSTYSIGNNSRVRFRAVGSGGGSGYGGDFRISTRASNNSWNTDAMTLDESGRLILLASTTTPATLATNGQLTFTATSDTNLRFSYRGSDGVTRTANLTLAP